MSESERTELEQDLGLLRPQGHEGRGWSYELADLSAVSLERLVGHAKVEDTQGIDRERFTLTDAPGTGWSRARLAWAFAVGTGLAGVTVLLGALLGIQGGAALGAPLLLGIACAVALVGAASGRSPFSRSGELSPPEAAATADIGTLRAMIAAGIDLTVRAPVRPGILGDSMREMTAYEAAVFENHDWVLAWMFRESPVPVRMLTDLVCLADLHERDQSRAVLLSVGAPAAPDCSGYEEPR